MFRLPRMIPALLLSSLLPLAAARAQAEPAAKDAWAPEVSEPLPPEAPRPAREVAPRRDPLLLAGAAALGAAGGALLVLPLSIPLVLALPMVGVPPLFGVIPLLFAVPAGVFTTTLLFSPGAFDGGLSLVGPLLSGGAAAVLSGIATFSVGAVIALSLQDGAASEAELHGAVLGLLLVPALFGAVSAAGTSAVVSLLPLE